MKKIFLFLLMSLVISPSQASGINVKREATTPKGGMRMPSITRVSADYDDGHITVDVKGYTGGVQVIVSDSQDNNVHGKEWTDAQWDAWCDQYDKFC